MNKLFTIGCSVALTALAVGCSPAQKDAPADYTQYVNPFIGAADDGPAYAGACLPFGLIQTSPVTGGVGWR